MTFANLFIEYGPGFFAGLILGSLPLVLGLRAHKPLAAVFADLVCVLAGTFFSLIGARTGSLAMAIFFHYRGLLTDDDGKISASNKAKVLEMLGFGNWESARELDELNKQRAKEENEAVLTQKIEPEEVDDDDIHIAEHSKALLGKGHDYSPAAKKRLIEHIRDHKRKKALLKSIEQGA